MSADGGSAWGARLAEGAMTLAGLDVSKPVLTAAATGLPGVAAMCPQLALAADTVLGSDLRDGQAPSLDSILRQEQWLFGFS